MVVGSILNLVTYSFSYFGNKTKRGVERRHSQSNISSWEKSRKRNVPKLGSLCLLCYIRDTVIRKLNKNYHQFYFNPNANEGLFTHFAHIVLKIKIKFFITYSPQIRLCGLLIFFQFSLKLDVKSFLNYTIPHLIM